MLGQLLTFEGFVGVTEGESFTDTEIGYWIADPGRWFGPEDHSGFQLTNEEFRVEWYRDPQFGGTPQFFESDVTIETSGDDAVLCRNCEGVRFANVELSNRPR